MPVALALLAGLLWAGSDYLVARAGRNQNPLTVVFTVQLVGIFYLVPLVLLGNSEPIFRDLVLGLFAGMAGSAGFVLFIKGASLHDLGVVIPLSAVTTAVFAVIVGLLTGDHYGSLEWFGIGAAFIGIAIVSRPQEHHELRRTGRRLGITLGLLSGVLFGILFCLLGLTSSDSGLWPLITARFSVIPLAILAHRAGAPLVPPRSSRSIVIVAALMAVSGLALFTLSARLGSIGVAAVITSMSPAGTVALAKYVDHEHVSQKRLAGILVVLISIGLLSVSP